MSRRLLLAAGLLILRVGALEAQDSAAMLHGMEVRLDSLRAVASRGDSLGFRSFATDTVRVGGLRIATSAALRSIVEAAAAVAWDSLSARYGASATIADSLPVMQFGGPETVLPHAIDRDELARGLAGPVAQAIWRRQGAELVPWLRGSFPMGAAREEDLLAVASQLARIPSRPNPACFRGDASACSVALGLRLGGDTLGEWYTPETWPRLAELMESFPSGREAWLRDRCAVLGDLTACRGVLTPSRLVLPVGPAGRQLLVEFALEAGGKEAFARLTSAHGDTIEHRLEAAAGIPADSLVARWIRAISAAADQSPAPGAAEWTLSLGWSAIVLLLAARGSRWR